MPYVSIDKGSPCVQPSRLSVELPSNKSWEGKLCEFIRDGFSEGHRFFTYAKAVARLRRLNAFLAPIRSRASVASVSNAALSEWMAHSIPAVCPRQSWVFPPIRRALTFMHDEIVRPIMRLRTSPIPIDLTPGHLSNATRRKLLYSTREVVGRSFLTLQFVRGWKNEELNLHC